MLALLVLESPDLWPLALGTVIALTWVVLWLYPPQVPPGGGSVRWALPILRWLGTGALALSILKPAYLRPKSAREWGTVLVLLDCSRSMGVADTGRKPAERVALAAALGRLPAGARGDLAGPLSADVQLLESRRQEVLGAQSDLDYARVSGRGIAERQQRMRDAIDRYTRAARQLSAWSASAPPGSDLRAQLMAFDGMPAAGSRDEWGDRLRQRIRAVEDAARRSQDAIDEQLYQSDRQVRATCDALAQLSRLDIAQEALLRPGTGLVARLGPAVPVTAMAIYQGLQPIALTQRGRPVSHLSLSAIGRDSDLAGAVPSAINSFFRGPLRAVVLLSDGRQVGGRGDLTSSLRPSGVPVFAVNVAPPQTPDVSIDSVVISSASAFAGESVEGRVSVRQQGEMPPPRELYVDGPAGRQVVSLMRQPLLQRDRGPREPELIARFAVPAVGGADRIAQRVVFSVPPEPGEVTPANNRVERWIKVSSDQLKVALCTGAPSWDFASMRSVLGRRRWIRLTVQTMDAEHPRLGLSPAEILDQDVLVLSDLPVDALNVNQWDAVNRLVNLRGGSVILAAGDANPIVDYARQPIARGLLPFHDVRPTWKEWPGEQPAFHFVPTPLGEREALRLGADSGGGDSGGGTADAGQRRWQELPGVYRYLQIPDRNLYPDVQKLLLEADSDLAVLTERRLGAGRVFFLGLNETWRWRLKRGEAEADRFWRQLVRYAAGEPYAASNGPLALDVDKVAIAPGEGVVVRARVRGARSPAAGAPACAVELVRDGKTIAAWRLRATGGGHFAATLTRDLPEGDYELRLPGIAGDGANVMVHVPLHVTGSDEAEMRDVSGDPGMLRRIARASGGQYLTIEQVDRVPERLAALRDTEAQFVRTPLWNSPFLFAFVLACFAGEWALRKRFGLT